MPLRTAIALLGVVSTVAFVGAASGAHSSVSGGWTSSYDWSTDQSVGYVGFKHDTTGASGDWNFDSNLGGNPGLWISPGGGHAYQPSIAEWTYTAPGTSRLTSIDADVSYRNRFLPGTCLTVGLRSGNQVIAQDRRCRTDLLPGDARSYHVSLEPAGSGATTLFFELALSCPNSNTTECSRQIPALDPRKNGAFARLKSVDMTLTDDDVPTVAVAGTFPALDGITVRNDETFTLDAHCIYYYVGDTTCHPVYGIYLGIAYTRISGNGDSVNGTVTIKELSVG